MSAAPVPEWDDDLMAVADATAVNPRLSIRTSYTDADYAAVLATWARQAAPPFTVDMSIDVDAPIDLVPAGYLDEATSTWVELDHAPCEGDDCDQTICLCTTSPCAGAVEQGCIHHSLLCHDCRHECLDCRVDDQADGPGWSQ